MGGQGRSDGANDLGIELKLLAAIERDSAVTQRSLARDLGIALGLANAYLRRCVKKGLVKIKQVPINRYAYYLTPQGFAEKSRLTAEYLAYSLDFFRHARADCAALFRDCAGRGWRCVALFGAGELAEIAVLSAGEAAVVIICVVDPASADRRCAGLAVLPDIAAAQALAGDSGLDAIMLTAMREPQASFEALLFAAQSIGMPAERIVAPNLLQISRRPPGSLAEAAA